MVNHHPMRNRNQVCVHVGGAGTTIGLKIWELMRHQHKLDEKGRPMKNEEHFEIQWLFRETFDTRSGESMYVPNAIFIDPDPTLIEGIKMSSLKHFFNEESLINGFTHTLNFAQGRNEEMLVAETCHQIRLMFEGCDTVTGCYFTRNAGGAAGSGIVPGLAQFTKAKSKNYLLEVVPSSFHASHCIEPLNYIFGTVYAAPSFDCVIPMDNNLLYQKVDMVNGENGVPTYDHMNQFIAKTFSSLTMKRFCSGNQQQLLMTKTTLENLCPYPSLKYITTGYAPYISNKSASTTKVFTLDSLTSQLFESDANFLETDEEGKLLACCFNFEGTTKGTYQCHEISRNYKYRFSPMFQNSMQMSAADFTIPDPDDWIIPKVPVHGFKFSNDSGITTHYLDWLDRYCQLFRRGAYLKNFLEEGMELTDFQDGFEAMKRICDSYAQVILNETDQPDVDSLSFPAEE